MAQPLWTTFAALTLSSLAGGALLRWKSAPGSGRRRFGKILLIFGGVGAALFLAVMVFLLIVFANYHPWG